MDLEVLHEAPLEFGGGFKTKNLYENAFETIKTMYNKNGYIKTDYRHTLIDKLRTHLRNWTFILDVQE